MGHLSIGLTSYHDRVTRVKDNFPSFAAMPHKIVFVVYTDFQLLDLAGPLATFQMAGGICGAEHYRCEIVSVDGGKISSSAGLAIPTIKPPRGRIDTLVVIGGRGAEKLDLTGSLVRMVRTLAKQSHRVASVCTGAFLLAQAGLLDGKRATTHWRLADRLRQEYRRVKVESDRIFIRDGNTWTSAGITAGVDLTLAMIEDDLGVAVSRALAQELVVYHPRSGGQSQFSAMLALSPGSDRIKRAIVYAQEHLSSPLTANSLAEAACVSPRHFIRLFRKETGETPAKAVERLRAEAAKPRVEMSHESMEAIAAAVGFTDPERMRRAFLRRFGQPPQAIRRQYKQNL